MKEKFKKITQSKIFIVVLLIVLISLIIGVGTYAWFTWTSTNNTSLTLSIGNLTDVTFDKGPDININNLAPVFNYTDGVSTTFSINNRDTSGTPATYAVKLNITTISNELKSSDFKFKLLQGTTIVSEGDFSSASNGGELNIGSGLINSGITNYTIYFYIDSNNENNPNMMNKNLTGTIVVSGIDDSSSPSYITLTNLGLSIDTAHTPDFTTCSGNSCTYDVDKTTGHGDGTNGIYSAPDDLGTSYYFRGAVNNNYVSFAGLTWRIVRINGDGTIRIALNGSAGTSAFNNSYNDNAYVGYMYGTPGSSTYALTHTNTNNSTIKTFLDNWYDANLSSYSSYIADAIYCNDRSLSDIDYSGNPATNTGVIANSTAYSGHKRINIEKNPSLICPQDNDKFTVSSSLGNGALTKAIGLLTADEYIMAGSGINYYYTSSNGAFYLYDGINDYYLTLTPDAFISTSKYLKASEIGIRNTGNYNNLYVNTQADVRPAVSLKSDAITGGNGTSGNPFVVS